ncbi:MAG: sugar transferase [Clostridiales bacterium]|nr:sugar transferase [Clostridiales bacterium]
MKSGKFKLFQYISICCLIIIFGIVFYLTVRSLAEVNVLPELILGRGMIVLTCCYCVMLYILLYLLEGLAIGRRRLLDLSFGFFMSALILDFACAAVGFFFVERHLRILLLCALIMTVFETVCGILWILVCHRAFERYHFCRDAIFIYGNREDEDEYVRITNTLNLYFKITKTLSCQVGEDVILQKIPESSIVYLGDIPTEIRNHILKFCQKNRIECYGIPKISDIYIQTSEMMQLNDKLLLKYPSVGISGVRSAVKRAADVVCSLILLAVTSPIVLVAAILIHHEDGGPVIYRQPRVTLDGRPFVMLKLRTMRVDAEEDGARLACKDDDRVTRVGRVLRNLHFDELPQLSNVLRGEMSMVGPRPEREEFIREYAEQIPEFPERLKVKGGLTGYAQVYGRYNSEPEDKIKYDLYYIYHYSLWLDIKLIVLTIRILFQKENTEGVEQGQINTLKKKGDDTDERKKST